MSAAPAPSLPVPHPQCTSSVNQWVSEAFEANPDWVECENRPWANDRNRTDSGCVGKDFVFYQAKVFMRFFWNEKTSELAGVVHWNENAEGPPKGAHGASVAMVFDEILAYPVWRSGIGAFTANLSVNLRRMVPLGSTQRFHSRVVGKQGRKINVEGRITSPDGKITYADSKGLWIEAPHMSATQQVDAKGVEKKQADGQQQQQLNSKL